MMAYYAKKRYDTPDKSTGASSSTRTIQSARSGMGGYHEKNEFASSATAYLETPTSPESLLENRRSYRSDGQTIEIGGKEFRLG